MKKVELMKYRENVVDMYVDAGFSLTPLRGKIPFKKNWQNTPYQFLLTLNELGSGNFGVVLKDDDFILDVDPRHFKNGENSLKQLMQTLNIKVFNCFTVKTGGGGLHLYFKKPADYPIFGKITKYPGIELKTKGSQVVGASCIHPETKKPYMVLKHPVTLENVDEVLGL